MLTRCVLLSCRTGCLLTVYMHVFSALSTKLNSATGLRSVRMNFRGTSTTMYHVLWPTCIFACRPLLLELSSLQRAELSFDHLIQPCLENMLVPLEYAYSASETILLFDGLYKLQ